jgi:hypothetical protein
MASTTPLRIASMSITIRHAEPDDYAAVAAIYA